MANGKRSVKRFFDPTEAAQLVEDAAEIEELAAGQERDFFFELASKARPEMVQDLPELLQKKSFRVTPLARVKSSPLNDHADEDALPDYTAEANQPTPYPDGESQQPAGHYLTITEIEIFVKPTLLPNTLDVLLEQHGVKVHYPDGRPPLSFPLVDVLNVRRHTPDAGVDATYDPVTGTQSLIMGPRNVITLRGRDAWIVKPGDTEHKLEFFRFREYDSAPALTGETADLNFYNVFRGSQYRAGSTKDS